MDIKINLVIPLLTASLFTGFACSSSSQQNTHSTAQSETVSNIGYAENAQDVNPILTGTRIPEVEIRNTEGDTIQIRQLVNKKPAVLIFYRGGWCPYCNKHMAELQSAEQQLTQLGYQIIAISPDRPELLKASIDENNLSYSLYSDSPMTASKAFGIAFRLDDETFNRYLNNGLDLNERSGHEHRLLPVPSVFLVDREGKVLFQYVNPDYQTRIKSQVLLSAAEAYYPDSEP